MNVELTKQEAQVLVNMIDIALKSVGIGAAEAALVLTRKIEEASKAETPKTEVAPQ